MFVKEGYRRDLDGLRAIAVLSIFLFHLDFSFASGGFIGVDVFYVISGFVIFRRLRHEADYNLRSVLAFYGRRIRRLFPALLTTVAASLLLGYAILSPREYAATVKSALAAIFSVSNIYFADTLSYFADGARTLPLLHTWSLGVEEQFYLTTPWLLVLLTRLGQGRRLFASIATLSLLSFSYNVVAKVRTIIFSSRWAMLASDQRSPSEGLLPKKIYRNSDEGEVSFQEAFEATLRRFTDLGVRILIIGPSPEFHFNVPNALIRSLQLKMEMPTLLRREFESRQAKVLETLRRVQDQKLVTVFYPHEAFCNDGECRPVIDRIPLYVDDNHLGPDGAAHLAPLIAARFGKLMQGD